MLEKRERRKIFEIQRAVLWASNRRVIAKNNNKKLIGIKNIRTTNVKTLNVFISKQSFSKSARTIIQTTFRLPHSNCSTVSSKQYSLVKYIGFFNTFFINKIVIFGQKLHFSTQISANYARFNIFEKFYAFHYVKDVRRFLERIAEVLPFFYYFSKANFFSNAFSYV